MEKTDVRKMKSSKLLDELEELNTDTESGMDRFGDVLEEIEGRVPFQKQVELEKKIDGIQHAVDKLKRHSHAEGKVVVAI